jgi:biotin carboxyl carrier protein
MRSFRINIAGTTYLVEVEDTQQTPIQVRVNGRPYAVEVEWQGAESEATVKPEIIPAYSAEEVGGQQTKRPPLPPTPRVSDTEQTTAKAIEAPMPGTILDIRVKVGDSVERGDELCVLEAMKMRNSIKSTRAGQIAEVLVANGAKVAYGDPLVRFA